MTDEQAEQLEALRRRTRLLEAELVGDEWPEEIEAEKEDEPCPNEE